MRSKIAQLLSEVAESLEDQNNLVLVAKIDKALELLSKEASIESTQNAMLNHNQQLDAASKGLDLPTPTKTVTNKTQQPENTNSQSSSPNKFPGKLSSFSYQGLLDYARFLNEQFKAKKISSYDVKKAVEFKIISPVNNICSAKGLGTIKDNRGWVHSIDERGFLDTGFIAQFLMEAQRRGCFEK